MGAGLVGVGLFLCLWLKTMSSAFLSKEKHSDVISSAERNRKWRLMVSHTHTQVITRRHQVANWFDWSRWINESKEEIIYLFIYPSVPLSLFLSVSFSLNLRNELFFPAPDMANRSKSCGLQKHRPLRFSADEDLSVVCVCGCVCETFS